MGVLGARPGDIVHCLFGGHPDACRRVYFGYYLFPRLQELLERLKLIETPIQRIPRPDPPPYFDELVPVMLAPFLEGDPSPQPSLPARIRLETTIKFRDGLKELINDLDGDIKKLEKLAKVK